MGRDQPDTEMPLRMRKLHRALDVLADNIMRADRGSVELNFAGDGEPVAKLVQIITIDCSGERR